MKKKHPYSSAKQLNGLISQYFDPLDGDVVKVTTQANESSKAKSAQADPPTITGLAFFLGFNSCDEFEDYENNGKFASHLKRARLHIMSCYEEKLHVTSSTGAIFALKSWGWNERPVNKRSDDTGSPVLEIKIIQTGPPLAASEKDVIL